MIVQHRITREIGFLSCFNWNQGRTLPVFVGTHLLLWKQEDIELLNDRPRPTPLSPPHSKKIHRDPFGGYTENELDTLWKQDTGYEVCKRFVKRIINFINLSYFRQDAQDY